ncbi:MAG: hypothetical protein GY850_31540, partial [bacterium]|nr:hypothetical protein [bacterium]
QRPAFLDNGVEKKSKALQPGTNALPDADLSAVLSFFSQAIHILVKDLEKEIGLQAFSILQGVLGDREAYPDFVSQFDVADDIACNVERLLESIKKDGKRYDGKSMATVCTQVLSDMINEERAFLGNRAVHLSLDKIEEKIAEISTDRLRGLSKKMVADMRN